MRVGYIVSRYPAVSHTFVQREVLGLRKLGWEVITFSIRRAPENELLTETDRAEAAATHVIVPARTAALFAALFAALCIPIVRPARSWHAFRTAWRLRRPGLKGTVWTLFYFLEALLVHRLCRRAGIAHLHAHFANVASDVAHIAAVLNGGTFSFTMHGPTEFFDVREHRLAEKAAAAKCVVCISDFARSQLMSMLPMDHWRKLEVVHCGVDLEQFDRTRAVLTPNAAGAQAAEVIGSIPQKSAGHEILCVARLTPVKGHVILLHALSELLMREHALTLTLVGDGPLRAELERRADVLGIADRVHFAGNVGQDRIAAHFTRADLFVLPSFAEGVPVVLMEAMAARCPVIATRIAGIAELIEHGTTGLLVPPGRADLLADAIERVLVNRAAAGRMALAGCEKVRREFNLAKVPLQVAAALQKHVEPRGWMAARAERRFSAAEWPGTAPSDRPTRTGLRDPHSAGSSEDEPRGAA